MKQFENTTIVIRRNEESDKDAKLFVETDSEKETIAVQKTGWGAKEELLVIPYQFADDVADALKTAVAYMKERNTLSGESD